jgi:sugar lactone lactonase YvrE
MRPLRCAVLAVALAGKTNMNRLTLPGWAALLLVGVAVTAGHGVAQTGGSVVTLDPAFARIAPAGATVEKLAGGFRFTEGPVWDTTGFLLFSDIPAREIKKWTPDGKVTTFRKPSGYSNGLTLDREGRLIACEHGNRRVSRTEKDGTVVALADRYNGKRLNSPNDVVVKSDGSIYFTDPPFGLYAPFGPPGRQELPYQGVFRLSPDGKLTLLVANFQLPNGLCFSPDEKTLYVDDSGRNHIRAFEVSADGTLANGRVFAAVHGPGSDVLDGLKVDTEGNLYCTGPGGILVFSSQGQQLGSITVPETTSNCAWGDDDAQTLYSTAETSLYRIRLSIPGMR